MQAALRVSPSNPSLSAPAPAPGINRRSASPAHNRLQVDEPIEWISLITMSTYHVLLILLSRYSLGYLRESYSLPVLITQIEGWKFIIAFAWIWITGANITDIFKTIWQYCSYRWIVSGTFIALISGFQFLALKHLPAFTFVVGQTLTLVCMFIFNGLLPSTTSSRLDGPSSSSYSILNARKLRLSLILLLGCLILYHDPPTEGNLLNQPVDATTMTRSNHIGYAALLIMCLLEGYAQVYVDRTGVNHPAGPSASPVNLAVTSPTSPTQQQRRLTIWERNLILSFWGMVVSFILLCAAEWSSKSVSTSDSSSEPGSSSSSSLFSHPLIHGMSLWSSGIVLFQSVGSLLLSANIRRMSSRVQNYATVVSICMVSVSSLFLLSLHSTAESLCGSGIVSIAVWSWNDDSSETSPLKKSDDVELDPIERRGLLASPTHQHQDEEHGPDAH